MAIQPYDSCTVAISQPFSPPDLLSRVRGEFLEMPGLRLSFEQAARLWALDHGACTNILARLVREKFLEVDSYGRFKRNQGGY